MPSDTKNCTSSAAGSVDGLAQRHSVEEVFRDVKARFPFLQRYCWSALLVFRKPVRPQAGN